MFFDSFVLFTRTNIHTAAASALAAAAEAAHHEIITKKLTFKQQYGICIQWQTKQ